MDNTRHAPKRRATNAATWMAQAGFGLLALTILFLMSLVVADIAGLPVQCSGRGLVIFVMALSTGGAAAFLSGEAAAEGRIPLFGGHVLKIATTGAIGAIVIVMALGFRLYAAGCQTEIDPDPDTPGAYKTEIDTAQRFWSLANQRRWKDAYGVFPLAGTKMMTFTQFESVISKGLSQFSSPPKFTRVENTTLAGSTLGVTLLAEFDNLSTFRQFLVFNKQGSDWHPWRFDVGPYEWPLTSGTKTLTEARAQDVMAVVASFVPADRARLVQDRFVGAYVNGSVGWQVVVDSIGVRRAERTCDVLAHEEITLVSIRMLRVLDGCDLKPSSTVRVVGRVHDVTEEVQLDAVRVWR